MVKLNVHRHGIPESFEFESVKEAASSAWWDIEENQAYPVSIEESGVIVWENKGPFTESSEKLRELAEISVD
jgi:hypothetical protein